MFRQILSFADFIVATITPFLNKIVAAFLIVFVGFVIGKILGNLSLRFFRDIDKSSTLFFQKKYRLAKIVSTIVSFSIYIIAIIAALYSLGVLWLVLLFIIFCFVVVLGFSFIFALKDFFPNFLARMGVLRKYPVGKKISYKDIKGSVKHVGITEIHIERKNGDIITIPHRIIKQKI